VTDEKKPAQESYPEGWRHATIHYGPNGQMHSDGDHSVRLDLEKRLAMNDPKRFAELHKADMCPHKNYGPFCEDCRHEREDLIAALRAEIERLAGLLDEVLSLPAASVGGMLRARIDAALAERRKK
jgi:hypothetical protein